MNKTLQQYIDGFITFLHTDKKISAATCRSYYAYLQRFQQLTGIAEPSEITMHTVGQFRTKLVRLPNQRGQKLKSSTQNYHLIALRIFLKYLHAQGVSALSPNSITLYTLNPKAKTTSRLQIQQLLEAPLSYRQGQLLRWRDKALLELLYCSGLKVSELCILQKKHYNQTRQTITVRGANSQLRAIALTNQAAYWLHKYLCVRTDNLPALFIRHDRAKSKQLQVISPNDYRLTPRTVQRLIKKYIQKIPERRTITPQSLRAAFAQRLLSRGESNEKIQAALGLTAASTKRYQSVS